MVTWTDARMRVRKKRKEEERGGKGRKEEERRGKGRKGQGNEE